ncbi:MAG: glycogen debranching enzyme GlgX, partial [Steroidobacteraceae bacterium]|nr:glycogen debranching enzyme GlgX [Steroidobacteraceae bacterium]
DTVSYNLRHNEANLESGADGHSHNLSWNCGAEGPTDDPGVLALRSRQAANLLATLFLSQGVPMLLAGDEFGQTQRGNNNAYCQDNEISWLDWSLPEKNAGRMRFVQMLIDLRRSRLWLRRDTFLKGARRGAHAKDVTWLHPSGRELTDADWQDPGLGAIAVHMNGVPSGGSDGGDLLVVFNAGDSAIEMTLPAPQENSTWRLVFDTDSDAPGRELALLPGGHLLHVAHRSTVLLESQVK